MSVYREVLYRNYSASFSYQKQYDATIQQAQYAMTYPALPGDHGLSIVDLGCGKGEWLGWLAQQGFTNLKGVDGSASDLEIARQHERGPTEWIEGDAINFLEHHPESTDILHAKDVIEHMTKDEFIRFLLAAHEALKPGGRLWLLTFNAQSPLSSATRYGDFTHETGHTPASLAQCLRACGFTLQSIKGRHYCSKSVGGRTRAMVSFVFYRVCCVVLKLRHGSSSNTKGVDLYTALPDLFVEAIRQ